MLFTLDKLVNIMDMETVRGALLAQFLQPFESGQRF